MHPPQLRSHLLITSCTHGIPPTDPLHSGTQLQDINKNIGPTDTLWSQISDFFFRNFGIQSQWTVGCPNERGIATLPVLINLHSYSFPSNWHRPFKLPPYQSQPTPSVSSKVRPPVKSFLASETSESSLHLIPHHSGIQFHTTLEFNSTPLWNSIPHPGIQFRTTLEFNSAPWNSIPHHSGIQFCTLEFNSTPLWNSIPHPGIQFQLQSEILLNSTPWNSILTSF